MMWLIIGVAVIVLGLILLVNANQNDLIEKVKGLQEENKKLLIAIWGNHPCNFTAETQMNNAYYTGIGLRHEINRAIEEKGKEIFSKEKEYHDNIVATDIKFKRLEKHLGITWTERTITSPVGSHSRSGYENIKKISSELNKPNK